MGVAVGRFDLENAVSELQDGDIEGTAAEVEDSHLHIFVLLIEAVREGRRGRLVDDAPHLEASDFARLLGCLALGVAEVCGYRDYRLVDGGAEVVFGGLLHLLKDHRRDLLRRIEAAVDVDPRGVVVTLYDFVRYALYLFLHAVVALAHEAFDGEDGLERVGDRLAFCRIADFALAVICKRHYGRGGAFPLAVDDDRRLFTLHYGYAAVGGAEVDSDDFSHGCSLLFFDFYFRFHAALRALATIRISNFVPTPFQGGNLPDCQQLCCQDGRPVHRSGYLQRLFAVGVYERCAAGVEAYAAVAVRSGGAVFEVAPDGAADGGELAPDLVVPPCQQLHLNQMEPLGVAQHAVA